MGLQSWTQLHFWATKKFVLPLTLSIWALLLEVVTWLCFSHVPLLTCENLNFLHNLSHFLGQLAPADLWRLFQAALTSEAEFLDYLTVRKFSQNCKYSCLKILYQLSRSLIYMRNRVFLALSVNKGYHSHQHLQPQPIVLTSPEGTQEGKDICHLAAIKLQSLPTVSPEEIPDMQTQDIGPR